MKLNPHYGYFYKGLDQVGNTQSGKTVLSGNQQSYSEGFSQQDHLDAEDMHRRKAAALDAMVTPGKLPRTGGQSHKHREMADWHNDQAHQVYVAQQEKEQKDLQQQAAESEEMNKGALRKKFIQKLPGGLADKKSPKDFDPKTLEEGRKVEMEHTDDPERAKEIAMDHLTEDPKYYTKLKTIEKSNLIKALENLSQFFVKGGVGSGVKGHMTARKPYPGEEAHNLPPMQTAQKTFMPAGGLMPHYTDNDNPELASYKNLLRLHAKHGMDYHGHITFDPETKRIHVLTSKGQENIKALQQHYGVKPQDSKE